jgi:hypothetical protein
MRLIGLGVVVALSPILVPFADRFGCHSYRRRHSRLLNCLREGVSHDATAVRP